MNKITSHQSNYKDKTISACPQADDCNRKGIENMAVLDSVKI